MFGSDSAVRLPLTFFFLFCPGLLKAVGVYVNPDQSFLNRQHEQAVNELAAAKRVHLRANLINYGNFADRPMVYVSVLNRLIRLIAEPLPK